QERALAGRVFAFAVALLVALINFAGHMGNGYRQALFAGASLVAFGVYLWRGACRRRDALIASGDMAAPAPLYPLSCYLPGRWKVTRLARELARRNRRLGMYGSLAAAEAQLARQRRHAALMAAI